MFEISVVQFVFSPDVVLEPNICNFLMPLAQDFVSCVPVIWGSCCARSLAKESRETVDRFIGVVRSKMDNGFGFNNPGSSFGTSPLFGMPSDRHEMNIYYLQQAQTYLMNNPLPQAHAQVQYWTSVVQAGQASAAAAAAQGMTSAHMMFGPGQGAPAPQAAQGHSMPQVQMPIGHSPAFGGQQGATNHHNPSPNIITDRCPILRKTLRSRFPHAVDRSNTPATCKATVTTTMITK